MTNWDYDAIVERFPYDIDLDLTVMSLRRVSYEIHA